MSTSPRQDDGTDTASDPADQPKRRDIIEGARKVFRAEGFDGASMGQIAQAASVSKGTLYVYFPSKEALFHELVVHDRQESAEQMFRLDAITDETDTRQLLQKLGESFVSMMVRPAHIALIRMVMGAAEKFPEAGRTFYETGPCIGFKRVSELLAREVEAGRLAIDCDLELAAAHFLNLCQGKLIKPQLFCHGGEPTAAEISETVASGVDVFLRAYAAPGKQAPGRQTSAPA